LVFLGFLLSSKVVLFSFQFPSLKTLLPLPLRWSFPNRLLIGSFPPPWGPPGKFFLQFLQLLTFYPLPFSIPPASPPLPLSFPFSHKFLLSIPLCLSPSSKVLSFSFSLKMSFCRYPPTVPLLRFSTCLTFQPLAFPCPCLVILSFLCSSPSEPFGSGPFLGILRYPLCKFPPVPVIP